MRPLSRCLSVHLRREEQLIVDVFQKSNRSFGDGRRLGEVCSFRRCSAIQWSGGVFMHRHNKSAHAGLVSTGRAKLRILVEAAIGWVVAGPPRKQKQASVRAMHHSWLSSMTLSLMTPFAAAVCLLSHHRARHRIPARPQLCVCPY